MIHDRFKTVPENLLTAKILWKNKKTNSSGAKHDKITKKNTKPSEIYITFDNHDFTSAHRKSILDKPILKYLIE